MWWYTRDIGSKLSIPILEQTESKGSQAAESSGILLVVDCARHVALVTRAGRAPFRSQIRVVCRPYLLYRVTVPNRNRMRPVQYRNRSRSLYIKWPLESMRLAIP
jgi:hypothetical protein